MAAAKQVCVVLVLVAVSFGPATAQRLNVAVNPLLGKCEACCSTSVVLCLPVVQTCRRSYPCTAGQGSPPGGVQSTDFPVGLHMLFNHLLDVDEAHYTFSASVLYVSPRISCNMCPYVTAFMGSVVFCVGRCLPVLLDASFATTANAETVISQLIRLDVAGMM